jgi:mRNA interferase MazF
VPPLVSSKRPIQVLSTALFRLLVEPTERNGLLTPSRLMVDKLTTVPKAKVGSQIGRLDDHEVVRLNRAIVVFLGLAGSTRA